MNTIYDGQQAVPTVDEVEDGHTVLKYVGRSWGTQTYFGPVSGTRYRAGLSRAQVQVKNEDLETARSNQPGLLQLRKHGLLVFELSEAVEAQETPEIEAPSPETETGAAEAVSTANAVAVATPPAEDVDLAVEATLELSVTKIKLLDHFSKEDYAALLVAEQAGQQRSTLISWLEEQLT